MKLDPFIKQEVTCEVGGRTWDLYGIDFESPDGNYSVYLYAISFEHAQLQLDALKETGKVAGKICGAVDA